MRRISYGLVGMMICMAAHAWAFDFFDFPGSWAQSISKTQFEDSLVIKQSFKTNARSQDICEYYRLLLTSQQWKEVGTNELAVMSALVQLPVQDMAVFQKEDVVVQVMSYPATNETCRYGMVNVSFPWTPQDERVGMFVANDMLYPYGTVAFCSSQEVEGRRVLFELVKCQDSPDIFIPYVTEQLKQRGWIENSERRQFREAMGMEDFIRTLARGSDQLVASAAPDGTAGWLYTFVKYENVQ
jgi:hypothetical protein